MGQLSSKLPWHLAQTKWAATLNPILGLPILAGNQIDSIPLVLGVPKIINHLLNRMPQGWFIVDNNSDCTVWRSASSTVSTITLTANADTSVSLYVY